MFPDWDRGCFLLFEIQICQAANISALKKKVSYTFYLSWGEICNVLLIVSLGIYYVDFELEKFPFEVKIQKGGEWCKLSSDTTSALL